LDNTRRLLSLVTSFQCREEAVHDGTETIVRTQKKGAIARVHASNYIKSIGEYLSLCGEDIQPIWLVAFDQFDFFLVDWQQGQYTHFIDSCLDDLTGLNAICALLNSREIIVVGYIQKSFSDDIRLSEQKLAMILAIVKKILKNRGVAGLCRFCQSPTPDKSELHREVCQMVKPDKDTDPLAEAIFKSFHCQSFDDDTVKTAA
jgi:hypothetical protein